MKLIFFLLAIGIGVNAFGQEGLEPLGHNPTLTKVFKENRSSSALHGSFIYLLDTMSLPFLDDFSRDHFKPQDAQVGDANVSDTTWFQISQSGTPFAWDTAFSNVATYKYELDTVPGTNGDSLDTLSVVELTSTTIDVFDLTAYPVASTSVQVWPSYNIYDSVWNGLIDTVELSGYYTQDSLTIYFVHITALDANYLWRDKYGFRNDNYPINPNSYGVATLDGLNEMGYPYDWSSASAHGKADELTSVPLDLGGLSDADSIYISFQYQTTGLGEEPDQNDSLVLEFWNGGAESWEYIWGARGAPMEDFKNVIINISSANYLVDGFAFRFVNHGALSGALDHWHIDYVKLDQNRTYQDTIYNDVAFKYPIVTMLKTYTSMPLNHYKTSPETYSRDTLTLLMENNYNLQALVANYQIEEFYEGASLNVYPIAGTTPNAENTFTYDADPGGMNWMFDTTGIDTCVVYNVQVSYEHSGDVIFENDTLHCNQVLYNYYSYDDGSAESAYGVQGLGSELAYRYVLPNGVSDTLRAIQAHFVSSVHDMSGDPFFIQVWDDNGGQPGDLLYTSDDIDLPILFTPQYNVGVNGFVEYILPEKVFVSGTYYIGWKQSTADRLNIGFDKNMVSNSNIFYKTSSSWNTSGLEGSLMLRPVFVNDKDPLFAGIESQEQFNINVYPNPANTVLNVENPDFEDATLEILDLSGKVLYSDVLGFNNSINMSSYANGIYLVRVKGDKGRVGVQKILVQH